MIILPTQLWAVITYSNDDNYIGGSLDDALNRYAHEVLDGGMPRVFRTSLDIETNAHESTIEVTDDFLDDFLGEWDGEIDDIPDWIKDERPWEINWMRESDGCDNEQSLARAEYGV